MNIDAAMNNDAAPTLKKGEITKESLLADLPNVIEKIRNNYTEVYDKFNNQQAAPSLEEKTILFKVFDKGQKNVAKVGFNGDIGTIQKLKTDLENQEKITIKDEKFLSKIKSLYINRRGIENYSEGHADDEIILNSEENPKRVLKSISFIRKAKDKNIKSNDKLIVIKYEEDNKVKEVIIDKENNFLATHDSCNLYWHSKDFKKGGNGFDDNEERVYVKSYDESLNIFFINNKITSINTDEIIKHLNKNKKTYDISEIEGEGAVKESYYIIDYNEEVEKWSKDINSKIKEFGTKYNNEKNNNEKFELFKDFTENILSMNHDNENDKNNLAEINILKDKASKELLRLTELIEDNDNKFKLTEKNYKTIKETIDEVLKVHNKITKELMNKEIDNKQEQKDDGYNWVNKPFEKRSGMSKILFILFNIPTLGIPAIVNKCGCCNKDAIMTLEDAKENKKDSNNISIQSI